MSNHTDYIIEENYNKELNSSSLSLDNILEDIYDKFLYFCVDENVLYYLNINSNEQLNEYNLYFSNIKSLLQLSFSKSYIHRVSLYNNKINYVYSDTGSNFLKYTEENKWINAENLSKRFNYHVTKQGFVICYNIFSGKTNIGTLCVEFNGDELINYINKFSSDVSLGLYNKETETFLAGANDTLMQMFTKATASVGNVYKDKNLWFQCKNTLLPNIILMINYTAKTPAASFPVWLMIICIISSAAIAMLLSYYISMHYYAAISNIVAEFQATFSDCTSQSDELRYISQYISKVRSRNENIEKELIDKISSLKLYQTLMLQCQINPHFIFNTLNTITLLLINECEDERPAEIISKLCTILASVFDTKNYLVSISQEIEYTKTYIEIIKISKNLNTTIIYNIDKNISHYPTLKFILQPIIENVFKHGKAPIDNGDGKITISAHNVNKKIQICVSNNFQPMTPSELETLRKRLSDDDIISQNHIGLANINNRIKIFFGNDYGITNIISNKKETAVYIEFPIIDTNFSNES